MKYELINPITYASVMVQILSNRGIPQDEIEHYICASDYDIADYSLLGLNAIERGIAAIVKCISANKEIHIVVDCDSDGFTSAAILTNYLNRLFPSVDKKGNLKHHFHDGKIHGLSDTINRILSFSNVGLVIVPDAGSNDFEEHRQLKDQGIEVLVLDHHEADKISEDAIIINNQLSDYPNKELSGAGVTWQFCKAFDKVVEKNIADDFLDLVALGLISDMMSLRSIETKRLIYKGLKQIKNPFFAKMVQTNEFSIGKEVTPIGVAFYVTPFINAIVRSGDMHEKTLVFSSMLETEAFKKIHSTKRGHADGELETVVEQAARVAANVKARQKKAQDNSMTVIQKKIDEQELKNKRVIVILCEQGEVDKNIAGLAANRLMGDLNKPICILTKLIDEKNGKTYYRGSARGCLKAGIEDFRQLCLGTNLVEYAQGHANAFGLSVPDKNIEAFIQRINDAAPENTETSYKVDYIFKNDMPIPIKDVILQIGKMKAFWGQDIEEPLITLEEIAVTEKNLYLMSPDKSPTLKILLPQGISIIKFKSSQEEYDSLLTKGAIYLNVIGTCAINEWNGNISPQLIVKDYEVTKKIPFLF